MAEPDPLELDLSLDPGFDPELTGVDPKGWEADIRAWLSSLRSNPNAACPDAVRQAEEISLGLRFTDDASIAELNESWRQRSGPTDVLSFAALDDLPEDLSLPSLELGDIVISVETAKRQAGEHGHSLLHELRWLLSHGLLHLLGWDHPDDNALAAMLQQQEHLLDIGHNIQSRKPTPADSEDNRNAH